MKGKFFQVLSFISALLFLVFLVATAQSGPLRVSIKNNSTGNAPASGEIAEEIQETEFCVNIHFATAPLPDLTYTSLSRHSHSLESYISDIPHPPPLYL